MYCICINILHACLQCFSMTYSLYSNYIMLLVIKIHSEDILFAGIVELYNYSVYLRYIIKWH